MNYVNSSKYDAHTAHQDHRFHGDLIPVNTTNVTNVYRISLSPLPDAISSYMTKSFDLDVMIAAIVDGWHL